MAADEPTYGRGTQVGNHAKLIMVDDAAFYMGSNNAYGAGLAEFGLIVDDAARAGELSSDYFAPLWQQARGTAASPGAISGADAPGGVCLWRNRLSQRPIPWSELRSSF